MLPQNVSDNDKVLFRKILCHCYRDYGATLKVNMAQLGMIYVQRLGQWFVWKLQTTFLEDKGIPNFSVVKSKSLFLLLSVVYDLHSWRGVFRYNIFNRFFTKLEIPWLLGSDGASSDVCFVIMMYTKSSKGGTSCSMWSSHSQSRHLSRKDIAGLSRLRGSIFTFSFTSTEPQGYRRIPTIARNQSPYM